jgi:hypothetical protein
VRVRTLTHDITFHFFPYKSYLITLSVHPPWFTHHKSPHHCWYPINTHHVTQSYSSPIFHLPSQPPNDPLAIYYRLTYPLNVLICPPHPTGIHSPKTIPAPSFAHCSSYPHTRKFPCLLSDSISSPTTAITTNVLFGLQVFFTAMVPKSKKKEAGENPFLPPPFNLDKIPLDEKDHLISDTRCEVDFANLQSWLKDTFLDQSDEIVLWDSNIPLYIFP